ncbi:alpha/beta-hydrolase [Cucurbitaria berberidis CBS 394.84]|uniref:Alpha/beta-hydrolase n=1 Tax=Cucurbitaria berberidis CBS 394.84 TaxID=1168544 RepID=A0A9P4G9C3_9PLEO|nr:alpha/beta-hydrolase [Cucurbitaria berberidis CBS 394.84]KAF1841364.1 alpha/beta-hydrolase [Cucurbitaria berberidis CBS 394.84]
MSPSNTSFFFISDAFYPSSCFHKVIPLLQARGYYVRALDLPSMNPVLKEKGKTPGLYDDANYVREVVSGPLDDLREGSNVILVACSYGSAVAFEACKGITAEERRQKRKGPSSGGQLKHLVLLSSVLAEPGPTIEELVGASIPIDPKTHLPVTHIDPFDVELAGPVLFGALPAEEQEYSAAAGMSISSKIFFEPLTFPAWKKVPTTVIIGNKDLAMPSEKQHEYFDKAVERGVPSLRKVVVEGGDHMLMLSHPDRVVQVCLEAAGDA